MSRVLVHTIAVFSLLAGPGIAGAEIGICCFADGSCIQVEEQECIDAGGCAFFPGAD
jgi:hypothetical protein